MFDNFGNIFSAIEKQIADGVKNVLTGQGSASGNDSTANGLFRFRRDSDGSLMVKGFAKGCTSASLVIPEGVTVIDKNAFRECRDITSVVFPESLEIVEKNAFRECKRLKSVIFRSERAAVGENAFENCSALEKIILPKKLFAAQPSAFSECAVRELCFPQETQLGGAAFISCKSLERISFMPADSEGYDIYFGDYLFCNCGLTEVRIPKGKVRLGNAVFFRCTNLKTAVLPEGIKEIPEQSFGCCSSLEEVVIPDTAEKICKNAFLCCNDLREVYIPDSVKYIESAAFSQCGMLSSVRLPAAVRLAEARNENGVMMYAFSYIAKSCTFTVGSSDISRSRVYVSDGKISMDDLTEAVTGAALEGDGSAADVISASPETFMRNILTGGGELGVKDIDRLLELISADKGEYHIPHEQLKIIDLPKTGERYLAGFPDGCSSDILNVPEGITHIASGAFAGNEGIQFIELPETLISIGASAFEKCTGLMRAELPMSLKTLGTNAFAGCTSLKQIILNNGRCVYGTGIFKECTALERITLPANMNIVPPEMFLDCSALEEAVIQNGVKSIGFRALSGTAVTSVLVPETVEEIGKEAFMGCERLIKVYIPENVRSIGNDAFDRCKKLNSFSLSLNGDLELLTVYRCIARRDMQKLKSVRISGRGFDFTGRLDTHTFRKALGALAEEGDAAAVHALERLAPEYAVLSCLEQHELFKLRTDVDADMNELIVTDGLADGVKLEEVHIPYGVTSIGSEAFVRCYVKKLYVPESVTNISGDAFSGSTIEEIHLPSSLNEIPRELFRDCQNLRKPVLSEGIEIIGARAFDGCEQLAAIVIPESMKIIRLGAFHACKKLRSIKLPLCRLIDSDSKWKKPFAGCDSLELAIIEDREYKIDEGLDMSEMTRIAADLLHEGNENARGFMKDHGEFAIKALIKNNDAARAVRLLSEFDGFNEKQIDNSIENALQAEQHEIYAALLGYKREKLGFGDNTDRFEL